MSDPDWSPPVPSRRAVLSGLASSAVVGTAGCSSMLASTTTLTPEIEQNGSVTTVLFADADEVRFSVRISVGGAGDSPQQYYPLSIATGDLGELRLSSFEVEFYRRGPESLFLGDVARSLAEGVEFYRSDDGRRTVLAYPDPGGVYETGSLQFPVVFRPSGEPPHALSGRVDVTLVNDGLRDTEYLARTQFEKELQ